MNNDQITTFVSAVIEVRRTCGCFMCSSYKPELGRCELPENKSCYKTELINAMADLLDEIGKASNV